ncbi:hypothetical protein HRI_003157700 [Hibiscus trionum]|uniref:Protein kinase domain-containing protein n=1 Tax=Hibiscus trionum TaxID=183268 RepID=A0A9W7IHM6_HIBTR|nr:hypothetical protein HRI_003157700 [Hibiscus trionum]
MGMLMPLILQLAKLCIIGFALVVHGSSGHNASSSPAEFSSFSPTEGIPGAVKQRSFTPSMPPQPNESDLHSPPAPPALMPAPVPEMTEGQAHSLAPINPMEPTPQNTASPPLPIEENVPSLAPRTPLLLPPSLPPPPPFTIQERVPSLAPSTPEVLPPSPPPPLVQVHAPLKSSTAPQGNEPVSKSHVSVADAPTPSANQENSSNSGTPIAPAPVATPSRNSPQNHTPIYSRGPTAIPPRAPIPEPHTPDPSISPVSSPPSSNDGAPVMSPSNEIHKPVPPVNRTAKHGSSPAPSNEEHNSSALSPSPTFHKHQRKRYERTSPAPASSDPISPPPLEQQGPVISPPGRNRRHHAPPPLYSVSPSHSFIPPRSIVSPVPSPFTATPSRQTRKPLISPKVSPSTSPKVAAAPPLPRVMSFPPPPPNEDCSTTVCTDPYTNTPPGSPCGCVLPMQVGLHLSVALYTFFPLVSELTGEIASGVFMKPSQVRIMGANAASEQPEKTVVLIDLVPLGEQFDNTTAFITYHRFWHKQVAIRTSLFGDYEVLYVRYLGLPPSPPLPPDADMIGGGPYSSNDNNARAIKPLGVDVHGKRQKNVLSGGVIAIIVMSVLVVAVLCSAFAWVLLFKHRDQGSQRATSPQHLLTSHAKPSGSAGSMVGSALSSISLSFGSSIAAYTGSAKTFTASEMERATDNFDDSRILGEGGFGRVYSGVLEDGTKVAVKVLKRDDQQGGREFLAEVEMLSRLHHRNLVKLIGICTEERNRCLVYELIPNGSVESHLHGVDKESAPLDWDSRIKIALGAARGLAYLHEDSSPRVIHRDFKSSNILLEHDFTPKVSDFGLARTAMDEEGRHISTRVMGTFGYVAPEYAMTGHLLVKSDVYSYGVVLLELLTGRKPVDMTQPPGRENLVAWARPLLATKEGLEIIMDPSLGSDVPFESVVKVAAIASMCVQPEVSHRPFMGEVVQALKLVCNECDEAKEVGSTDYSQHNLSIDMDGKVGTGSGRLNEPLQSHYSIPSYDVSGLDTERGLSVSDLFSSSTRFRRQSSESFMRHCSSGPLRTGRGSHFWQKMQRLSRGSISEHGVMMRFWTDNVSKRIYWTIFLDAFSVYGRVIDVFIAYKNLERRNKPTTFAFVRIGCEDEA